MFHCGRACGWLLALLAACLAGGRPQYALGQAPSTQNDRLRQNVAEPAGQPRPVEAPAPRPVPDWPFDVWYLRGDDGRPVVVPNNARVREYLTWLARQREAQAEPAEFSLTELSFDATTQEDRLTLKVDVRIQVLANEQWVTVPLHMGEATLREVPVHTGPGEFAPAPNDLEDGYACSLRGKGAHRLTMVLGMPIRRQGASRRVQLTLPASVVSSFRLRVPAPKVVARAGERSLLSTASENGGTLIEVLGLGERLDLTWQLVPETPGSTTDLDVFTAISATLEEDSPLLIDAQLRIQSLNPQSPVQDLRIELPSGGELLRLDSNEDEEHRTDPADRDAVLLRLKHPTTAPVELHFVVRFPEPSLGEPILFSGFGVDHARVQAGFLALAVAENYRLVPVRADDQNAKPLNVADLPAKLRQTRTTAAWRFADRLRFRATLERVDPYISGSASMVLSAHRQELGLLGTWRLQVLRGHVSRLTLEWPGWKASEWTIEALSSENRTPAPRLASRPDDADRLELELAEPVQGPLEIRLRARRRLSTILEPFRLTLPSVQPAALLPAHLTVLNDEGIELELHADAPEVLERLEGGAPRGLAATAPDSPRRADYTLNAVDAVLSGQIVSRFAENIMPDAGEPANDLPPLSGSESAPVAARVLVQTTVHGNGTVHLQADYRLSNAPERVTIRMPRKVRASGFWWNALPVRAQSGAASADGDQEFVITRPDGNDGTALVTITASETIGPPARLLSSYALEAPVIGSDIRVLETFWRVTVPEQQHLFTDPSGFVGENQWRRAGLVWSRRPSLSREMLEDWIDASPILEPALAESPGNTYLFSRSGAADELSFRGMAQSGIVLTGAGVALLLGLTVVRWPATRNVLSVLCVAFLAALASVWYATPVLVLLQPALLGLLLAGLAVGVDVFLKRRRGRIEIGLRGASEFEITPLPVRTAPLAAATDEFGVAHDLERDPDALAAEELSESGSHV